MICRKFLILSIISFCGEHTLAQETLTSNNGVCTLDLAAKDRITCLANVSRRLEDESRQRGEKSPKPVGYDMSIKDWAIRHIGELRPGKNWQDCLLWGGDWVRESGFRIGNVDAQTNFVLGTINEVFVYIQCGMHPIGSDNIGVLYLGGVNQEAVKTLLNIYQSLEDRPF